MLACVLTVMGGCAQQAPVEDAACDGDHPCPERFDCKARRCVKRPPIPPGGCVSDDDCSPGDHCDASYPGGICLACVHDAHCPGQECVGFPAKHCGCETNADCEDGWCDRNQGFTCQPCHSDAQCAPRICSGTRCKDSNESAADAERTR